MHTGVAVARNSTILIHSNRHEIISGELFGLLFSEEFGMQPSCRIKRKRSDTIYVAPHRLLQTIELAGLVVGKRPLQLLVDKMATAGVLFLSPLV